MTRGADDLSMEIQAVRKIVGRCQNARFGQVLPESCVIVSVGGGKTIRLGRNDCVGGAGISPADLRMYTLPRGIRQRENS